MFHKYSHNWKEIFRLADFIQLFATVCTIFEENPNHEALFRILELPSSCTQLFNLNRCFVYFCALCQQCCFSKPFKDLVSYNLVMQRSKIIWFSFRSMQLIYIGISFSYSCGDRMKTIFSYSTQNSCCTISVLVTVVPLAGTNNFSYSKRNRAWKTRIHIYKYCLFL